MKIALLSDAHGNAPGLRACLRTLNRLGVSQIYFLGDAVGYYPGEREVLRLLEGVGACCQQGNHEAMLLGRLPLAPERDRVYQLNAARARLSMAERAVPAGWPDQRVVELEDRRLLLVHGSPTDPLQGYLYPDSDLSICDGLPYDAVFVGHTHRPFVAWRGTTLVVNVGSCGLPRDEGDLMAFAVYDSITHSARVLRVRCAARTILDYFGPNAVIDEVYEVLQRRATGPVVGEILEEGIWTR